MRLNIPKAIKEVIGLLYKTRSFIRGFFVTLVGGKLCVMRLYWLLDFLAEPK